MKKAAVINDLSGFGRCSLTVFISILSVMGIQPCPVPTAVLTNQTGFQNFRCFDLTDKMPSYTEMWLKNGEVFDGICSGYVANEKQLEIISDFISHFHTPSTQIIVDPVMGDDGKLYPTYNKSVCEKMRALVKAADIITPNLTELCVLTDYSYNRLTAESEKDSYIEKIAELVKRGFPKAQSVAVTGIRVGEYICNLISENGSISVIKSPNFEGSFSGTGDIFSSIVCGSTLLGKSLTEAADTAAKFIGKAIESTIKEPFIPEYGVNYEKFLTDPALLNFERGEKHDKFKRENETK